MEEKRELLSMIPNRTPRVVWTIAGFDPSNGAGVTADLQVFAAHGLFGASAITALTVQSTQGVAEVAGVDPAFLYRTLEHLAADLPPAGVKIGMLGSAENVEAVASFLQALQSNSQEAIPIVLDPVLRATSGASLLPSDALGKMDSLLRQVSWTTPNWNELAWLSGLPVNNVHHAREAIKALRERHTHLHIVATGGDQEGEPVDLWTSPAGATTEVQGTRIATTSTHGTGCAFSSALLSHLVLGLSPLDALQKAKSYVEEALRTAPNVGNGRGPMNLLWPLTPQPRR